MFGMASPYLHEKQGVKKICKVVGFHSALPAGKVKMRLVTSLIDVGEDSFWMDPEPFLI